MVFEPLRADYPWASARFHRFVIDGMSDLIGRHLDKKGAGEFVLPGLFKIATIRKPATKARKGINPFTKEEVVFKAKPARTVIKVRPLKKLKEMV